MFRKLINPAWAIAEYLWYPILVFAATPYFLKTLGAANYGLWMLLTATVGIGGVLNTGTGAATIKLISASLGAANSGRLAELVQNAIAIALIGGAILAVLVFGAFTLGSNVLFDKMGDRQLVYLTGFVGALLIWVEQLDNVLATTIKGAEKFGPIARLEIVSKTVQMLAALGAVMAGGGLLALYAALFLVSIARLAAKAMLARRLLGIISYRPRLSQTGEFLRLSKWGWLQGLGAALFNSADRFIVGSMFGAATLGHYSVILMLPQQIHAIAAAGLSVIFPMVSRKSTIDPTYTVDRSIWLAMLGCFILSVAGTVLLWIFGEVIFLAWLSAPMPADAIQTYKALVIAYFILALNILPHYVLLGLGKIRFIALANLIAGALSLIAMAGAAKEFGLVGVGACRILYAAIAAAVFIPFVSRLWQFGAKPI